MEFKEAMRIFNRICKEREFCEGCVLEGKCIMDNKFDPDEIEAILAKRAEEHPGKTIMDDFFEKHPKAERGKYGTPDVCAGKCGYVTACPPSSRCSDCWRRPLEEVE